MKRIRYSAVVSLATVFALVLAVALFLPRPGSAAPDSPTMQALCGSCTPEVFARGGKFLEGPAFDRSGNLWVVSIDSGWVSKITPDGKWENVFTTGGQPQGLKFARDGRLFGVDRKKGVFVYDPKTEKLSEYVLYYQNQNFKGPNDLIFDGKGGLYFTDPWGTSPANPHGSVYYIMPDGKSITRILDNVAFPNGIALSPDEKDLYVADFGRNDVWDVPLVAPGVINQGFVHVMTYLDGGWGPDGMALDANGNIYQAHYGAGEVAVIAGPKYHNNGKIIGYIELPESGGVQSTNVAFGGPGHTYLYITEAGQNVIYRVKMNVVGLKLYGDE
jgi:gluconolactonase